jgi:hypothetical protein
VSAAAESHQFQHRLRPVAPNVERDSKSRLLELKDAHTATLAKLISAPQNPLHTYSAPGKGPTPSIQIMGKTLYAQRLEQIKAVVERLANVTNVLDACA